MKKFHAFLLLERFLLGTQSHRSSGQKQVTGPQLPAEPGSGCPNLSQYVVQHSQPQARLEKHRAVGKVVVVVGHITGSPCFWLNMGLEQSQNQGRSSESRGSFSWFGLSIPWNQWHWFTAEGGVRRFCGPGLSFSKCFLATHLYTLLFIRPVSPVHTPIQSNKLKIDHLDCPGVLSSCSSKSE